jgi:hypothetical protein
MQWLQFRSSRAAAAVAPGQQLVCLGRWYAKSRADLGGGGDDGGGWLMPGN